MSQATLGFSRATPPATKGRGFSGYRCRLFQNTWVTCLTSSVTVWPQPQWQTQQLLPLVFGCIQSPDIQPQPTPTTNTHFHPFSTTTTRFEPNFMFLTRNGGFFFWHLTCVFYHFGALALILECYHVFMVYAMHFHPTTAFPTHFQRLSHISSNNNYCQPFSIISGPIYTKPAASGHTHLHSLSLVATLNCPAHSQQITANFDSFQPSDISSDQHCLFSFIIGH